MKFCKKHWQSLCEAIENYGLAHYVAKTGEEAIDRISRDLEGNESLEHYDPLASAHNTILVNAIEIISKIGGNPNLMFQEPCPPEYECPLCYLNHLAEEHDKTCLDPNCTKMGIRFDDWVDKAANGQREYLEERLGRGILH